MRLKHTALLFILLTLVASLTIAQPQPPVATEEVTFDLVVEIPGLLPEGIEYDAERQRFLLGSLSTGSITSVSLLGGTQTLIEDEDLISSVGIHIDAANDRLLVANSDRSAFGNPDSKGLAALAAYDLETGERLYYAELSALTAEREGQNFANDVTVDADGNAYVTNSFQPLIYKVDIDGNAEVFIEDEQLTAPGFGLNGIDFHPDGYLLAAVGGSAAIFKIPLDDPEALTQVELSEPVGIDGMVIAEDGSVIAVGRTGANSTQEIVQIVSEDEWATAEIVNRVETGGNATTVTLVEDVPHYINAYLNNPAQEAYEIVPVEFVEAE
jgi:sugar lactone lactonase YvrE